MPEMKLSDESVRPMIHAEAENSVGVRITLFLKRVIDVAGSSIGLLLLSPLFLTVAVLIKRDSPGPVFFRQTRLGKYGRPYKIFKYRTMVQNSQHMGSGLYSYAGDPRITKTGKWLRSTSIDELPQLINVFRGEMSLVGPRPPVEYELGDFEALNSRYKKRFRVKPGMTGLAQVMGRNNNTWDSKVNFDNEYIERLYRKGFWVDIWLLIMTVGYVLHGSDIEESKMDVSVDDVTSAEMAEKEILRRAHQFEDEDIRYESNKSLNG